MIAMPEKLNKFKNSPVEFVETMDVSAGVECDVYKFVNNDSCDLGVIRIKSGCKTPRQLVLAGDKTVEGFISGGGRLVIESNDDKQEYAAQSGLRILVEIGQIMQWQAAFGTDLVVYEICQPPYQPGRFKNLS